MTFAQKNLRVLPVAMIGGRHVKRYEVTTPGLSIEPDLWAAAERYLPSLYPTFEDLTTPPATFIVLHRGSAGMYLNAYSWTWDNVIHCRTAASGEQPFVGSHNADLAVWTEIDKPLIGCVWELPPLEHERKAWVRHMLVPERANLDAYLADVYPEGPVGL